MTRNKSLARIEEEPPLLAEVSPFDYNSGPKLSARTVDGFLRWAAFVPVADVDIIRKRIADAREEVDLFETLDKELWSFPVSDVSRHRLLLSTIGELKNPGAVNSLVEFIWHNGEITTRGNVQLNRQPCSFERDGDEILQARATEMLSHLGSAEAAQATLDIAARHPSNLVRAAAIDAFMFNAGDSPAAATQLHNIVRQEDVWRIGLPRLTADVDPVEFEKSVLDFYNRYPSERPPVPHHHKSTTKDAGKSLLYVLPFMIVLFYLFKCFSKQCKKEED
jgi:hypothetical protein